ncbi:MAG: hypothetical protein JKY48_18610 [Flavobacteriales bacterium]|nr:hypothetical protein [Flavobacteriales bacterium]
MENNKNSLLNQLNEESKRDWVKPEVLDLDVNKETQTRGMGSAGGDGGGFFNDYVS